MDDHSASQESALEEITLDELLTAAIADRLIDLHVALPVRVEKYDASKQTVDVTPMINRYVPDGDGAFVSEPLPQLRDVPVSFPRGQAFSMTFPLQQGDFGLVVFCERNIGSWRSTGAQGDPGDVRTHSLDGAVFVPGLMPDSLPSNVASGSKMIVGSESDGNSRIELGGGVNLGAGATKGVARVNDPVAAATSMLTWISAVSTFLNTAGPLVGPAAVVPPTDFGKVQTGSMNIKAVD